MKWSPALPMGMALEGGEGGDLDAGGGVWGSEMCRGGEGRVQIFRVHMLDHRNLKQINGLCFARRQQSCVTDKLVALEFQVELEFRNVSF